MCACIDWLQRRTLHERGFLYLACSFYAMLGEHKKKQPTPMRCVRHQRHWNALDHGAQQVSKGPDCEYCTITGPHLRVSFGMSFYQPKMFGLTAFSALACQRRGPRHGRQCYLINVPCLASGGDFRTRRAAPLLDGRWSAASKPPPFLAPTLSYESGDIYARRAHSRR